MAKKYLAPIILLSLFLVLILLIFPPLEKSATEAREFVIQKGDGSAKVARLLVEQKLVRSRYLFIAYTLFVGKEKDFKAGRYLISPSMSIPKIVRIFSVGEALPEGELVTIPEGFNAWEVAGLLKKKGFNAQTEELLKSEGYLFPDSYYFEKPNEQMTNDKTGEIIKKMRENFEEKTRGLTITPQAVIVASMLEKEVRKAEDMALVAGIIYKRLELGMPLQIDATVAYGVCRPDADVALSESYLPDIASGSKHCDITQVNLVENIKVDNLYNTYTRRGMPAGAISNPGLRALNAALNPQASDYLYYLSARDDGRTIFSKTAEEHQLNRAKYLPSP